MSDKQLTCSRCNAIVPPGVFDDTGGLCRTCQKTVPKPVEVADLVACMRGNDKRYRGIYFHSYGKRKPSVEALPILRQAVLEDDHFLVKCAAVAIGKLRESAAQAVPDLYVAAARVDQHGMPQAYRECLLAIVSIDRSHPELVPLIRRFIHICNWVPIKASLEALAKIGTDESLRTMQEIRDRWYPKFSKTQKRIADQFLAESKEQQRG